MTGVINDYIKYAVDCLGNSSLKFNIEGFDSQEELIQALKDHKIAGAGLDVQETEPPVEDNPLYTLDNVILTPHMGWKGLETRQRLLSILKGNIDGFINGKPVNVVS